MRPFPKLTIRLTLAALLWGGSSHLTGGLSSAIRADTTAADSSAHRIQRGLQILYDFSDSESPDVKDRAAVDPPLDLKVADTKAVRNTSGSLEIVSSTAITSDKPPAQLITAVRQSNAITIEAWIRPANLTQNGPARIVTLSLNSGERNFTLGQDGDKLEVRLRTTQTTTNGMPAVVTPGKSLTADVTHVAYTRDRSGNARLYVNGKKAAEQKVAGDFSNWDGSYRLALANELSNDRPWLGTYRLVAIYSRDLSVQEIEQNFRAGAAAVDAASLASTSGNARLFETRVAPILSQHCLECHDAPTKKGGLDLSRKAVALKGGDSGPAFVPGKSAESLFWRRIESNEMPHDRPPLSADDKALLRQWLNDGAAWSLEVIDPAVYTQGGSSRGVFVQRLTVPEYVESVRSTLGVDIAQEAREVLPRDLRADGFSNTAYNLNVDLGHVEAYAKLAEIIVGRIDIKALARKHTKSRELTDENVTKVIKPVGRLLLRGPLNPDEIARHCGISTTVGGAGGNFEDALRHILEAMLQSPRFLYRMESQRGDGSPVSVGQFELASRLSYILWGGPPDDALLDAAEKNGLDRKGVESQVQRMLKDRRAVDRSRQFVSEWLNLNRLDNLRPNPKKFPQWDPALAADMRQETLAFFEEIVWTQNRPLSELLNAQVTFLTPRLAKHYGMPINNDKSANDKIDRYDVSSVLSRGGLLRQGSVLTVGGDEASTVTRGLFVMHELLRGVVRDPPPCVDTSPVPTKPGLTKRAIAESRLANKSCTGCHAKFEPLSFGLEKFDGLGSYHEIDEHGNQLREDGEVLFPGEERPVAYKSSAELMDLLAKSERVRESFTWKITQFALGRPLDAEDAPIVVDIHRAAQQAGGTYANLMTEIVLSDVVQTTRTEAATADSRQ